jgi:hypothetical protein
METTPLKVLADGTSAPSTPPPAAHSFCAVPTSGAVFAGPRTKEEFDSIPLPETVHDWKPDKTETLLRNDGQQYERRCHSKMLGEPGTGSVYVIFQWFDVRIAGSEAQP